MAAPEVPEGLQAHVLRESQLVAWLGPLGEQEPPVPADIPDVFQPRTEVGRRLLRERHLNAVCKIDVPGVGQGSGFHYGNGWVMTNAHVLGNLEEVAAATFSFTSEGGDLVFNPHPRFGLRARIDLDAPDPLQDPIPDLALVKLGHQFEYGRHPDNYLDWEQEEQNRLPRGSLVQMRRLNEDLGNHANVVHFGGELMHQDLQHHKQISLANNNVGLEFGNATVRIFQHNAYTCGGSSGAPVFSDAGRRIGVHFCGGENRGYAIRWDPMVYNFAQLLMQIQGRVEVAQAYNALFADNELGNNARRVAANAHFQALHLAGAHFEIL